MQGTYPRFKTKKALKEAVRAKESVNLEATSIFENEYEGPLTSAPTGKYYIVGPDPHRFRKWYAQIIINKNKITVK